ncbi:hypothetical protein H0178_52865 [Cytobacillus firmus]|nr:hypothetical protein [Cytobacillus firmus]
MDGRKAGITAASHGLAGLREACPLTGSRPGLMRERPGLHSTGRTIIIPIGGEAL